MPFRAGEHRVGTRTSLADFIEGNVDRIVDEAEAFASSQMPDSVHLNSEDLRDHLPEVLAFIASDMRTGQTEPQRRAKSEGRGDSCASAAHSHGRLRAKAGFNIDQMVAEYRAMRASVLRLWLAQGATGEADVEQMIRFNEAVDQAIAESVADFAAESEAWRHVFLGVLGHDLRGPLNVMMLTSELLSHMVADTPYAAQTARLIKSGRRMNDLLDDLLDYSRTSLGMGIRINRTDERLAEAVLEEIEELRAAFPDARIELEQSGATDGSFDASRVREALCNLVTNAVKYGNRDATVRVSLQGTESEVRLVVQNQGSPSPAISLDAMFEPLRRGAMTDDQSGTSLGLGLFIVREIAKAHGGEVSAEASEDATTFTLRLAKE